MVKKLSVLILVLGIVLSAFASCSDVIAEENSDGTPKLDPGKDDLRVVMTIDGYEITYDVYRYFFMMYKYEYDQGNDSVWSDPVAGEALVESHKNTVLSTIKRLVATQKLAETANLSIEADAIQEAVTNAVLELYAECNNSISEYKDTLKEGYLTDHAYRYVTAVSELESRLYLLSGEYNIVNMSDSAALASINSDDFICVKQILIKNDEGDDFEENSRIAENALARARAGEDFDKLIRELSEDQDVKNLGDGYYFTKYQYIESFEDAAFALEVGEISEVVKTEIGYSVIKRLEKDPEYIQNNFSTLKDAYSLSKFYEAVNKTSDELSSAEYGDIYTLITVFNEK